MNIGLGALAVSPASPIITHLGSRNTSDNVFGTVYFNIFLLRNITLWFTFTKVINHIGWYFSCDGLQCTLLFASLLTYLFSFTGKYPEHNTQFWAKDNVSMRYSFFKFIYEKLMGLIVGAISVFFVNILDKLV